jgi:hypothetical protein
MHIGLATGAGHHLAFDGQGVQEIVNPLGGGVRIQALA